MSLYYTQSNSACVVIYKFIIKVYVTASTSCIEVCVVFSALIEYKNICKKTLQESIESEMSGNLEKLLVAVGEENTPSPDFHFFA